MSLVLHDALCVVFSLQNVGALMKLRLDSSVVIEGVALESLPYKIAVQVEDHGFAIGSVGKVCSDALDGRCPAAFRDNLCNINACIVAVERKLG